MRSRDEVLREFCGEFSDVPSKSEKRMADRIRELEAQQAASEPVAWAHYLDEDTKPHDVYLTEGEVRYIASPDDRIVPLYAHPSAAAVTVTEAMVNAAARRGRDYGFNAYCDNAQEYWAAMESVLTTALQNAASEGASDA